MAVQDYAIMKSFMNSNALIQVTSCSLVTNSGQQRVDLMIEGLGGFTPGSGDCTLEVGFAVPIGGPEENFQAICVAGEYVDMQIFLGSQTWSNRGKITEHRISQSTGQAVEGTFTFVSGLKAFE